MSGNNTNPGPVQYQPSSVREAAIKLLADLDAQRFAWDKGSAVQLSTAASIGQLRTALQNERSALLDIENPQLAAEGVALIKRGADPALVTPAHIQAIVAAAEAAIANEASGAIRWNATTRAIKRWQADEPSPLIVTLTQAARAVYDAVASSDGTLAERLSDMLAAIANVETFSIEGSKKRDLIWPDHVDLLVWLLELVELQPACPSIHVVADQLRVMRQLYAGSPAIQQAADSLEALANALVASSRRTVVAESNAQIIPKLIAAWLRSNELARNWRWAQSTADAIEAGEWLPLRGAAIRSSRAQLASVPSEPIELQSGCEAVMIEPDRPRFGPGYAPDAGGRPTYHGQPVEEPGEEEMRTTLEANVNRFLKHAAQDAGVEQAKSEVGDVVADLAPGWTWAPAADLEGGAPQISLIAYEPDAPL